MTAPPIFVLGLMRSATTLVLRILNCHPDITVWGEHGGALRSLLRAEPKALSATDRERITSGYERREVVIGELGDHGGFDAWVSPVLPDEIGAAIDSGVRRTLEDLFTRGLDPHVRWGFKETRYARPVADRLAHLYPAAHFVVVTRPFVPWVSSVVRAPWRSDLDPAQLGDQRAVEHAVADLRDLWTQRTTSMLEFAAADPTHRIVVAPEALDLTAVGVLFDRLGVDRPDPDTVARVLKTRTGSSDNSRDWNRRSRRRLHEHLETMTATTPDITELEHRMAAERLS